jgi:hypothetical protein
MTAHTNEPTKESRFSDSTKATVCIFFLAISVGVWLSLETTWAKIVYYLIFLLPNYACVEWLGSKLFSEQRGFRISQSGFSIERIFIGVVTALALFGIVYGLAFIGKWILFS